jgi:hypothetical protein
VAFCEFKPENQRSLDCRKQNSQVFLIFQAVYYDIQRNSYLKHRNDVTDQFFILISEGKPPVKITAYHENRQYCGNYCTGSYEDISYRIMADQKYKDGSK